MVKEWIKKGGLAKKIPKPQPKADQYAHDRPTLAEMGQIRRFVRFACS